MGTSLMGALLVFLAPTSVFAETNCYLINECSKFRRDPSSPSPGTQVKINPSAVPTDKGFGVETIYFSGGGDFSLVRGNGRMGASISPTNSEETFFGAPAFESLTEFSERKYKREKYDGQKFTLATAFDIADRKGNGFRRYALKLGLMGKYNKLTEGITPGGGLSAIWGPLSVGYSAYQDETQVESDPETKTVFKYQVQTYNVGLYLNSLTLNYAHMDLNGEEYDYEAVIHVYTASLALGKFIFTGSKRVEDSPGYAYDYEEELAEPKQIKEEYFGGIQYSLTQNFMLGVLYNYYLMREFSATATLFF